jgi:hypothetical protein
MAKGLSPLQRAILRELGRSEACSSVNDLLENLPDGVISRESLERRVSQNSLRRALHRLWERGLIMRTAQPSKGAGGRLQHAWGLATEEVRAYNFQIAAGFVVHPACPLYRVHGSRVLPDPRGTPEELAGNYGLRILALVDAKKRAEPVRMPRMTRMLQRLASAQDTPAPRRRPRRG